MAYLSIDQRPRACPIPRIATPPIRLTGRPPYRALHAGAAPVQIDLIRFDEHIDRFSAPLQAERENDPDQNIFHYQEIYFRDIVPRRFPVEIRYTELDTGVERYASFTADRRPRHECAFVMFLRPDGPELSDCRRSDLEDFDSPWTNVDDVTQGCFAGSVRNHGRTVQPVLILEHGD